MEPNRYYAAKKEGFVPSKINFIEDTITVSKEIGSINKLFLGGQLGFVKNNKSYDNIFLLGWDSIALFDLDGDKFKLKSIEKFVENKFQPIQTDIGREFNQISTYVVDTCTFLYLKNDTQLLIVHFDTAELNGKKLKKILDKFDDYNANGFVSYIDDSEGVRTAFVQGILKKHASIQKFNRNIVVNKVETHFGHLEIGIYYDDDKNDFELYGDILFAEMNFGMSPIKSFIGYDQLAQDNNKVIDAALRMLVSPQEKDDCSGCGCLIV